MNQFACDYYRMMGKPAGNPLSVFINMLLRHNLRYAYWLRKAQKGSLLGKIQCYRYSRKYGLEISPSARIGEGLYLGHPYCISVNGAASLGRNVNLHKGCTIGVEVRGKREGAPTIGNNVWCGVNATIVGNITIGDDVLIAPGAFVNFDVPSHSVVLGNPGVIHHAEDATGGYVCYRI